MPYDCIEPRLAAKRIESWIDLDADETSVAHGEGVLERGQGAVVIAQLSVDAGILIARRFSIKLFELREFLDRGCAIAGADQRQRLPIQFLP